MPSPYCLGLVGLKLQATWEQLIKHSWKERAIQRLVSWFPLLAIAAIVTVMKPWQTLTQTQDAIAQTQQGQSQIAQVVPGSIYDSDTLRVNINGTETRIRLCGIDAPER